MGYRNFFIWWAFFAWRSLVYFSVSYRGKLIGQGRGFEP